MLTISSLPTLGRILRMACGSTTVVIVCQWVMPMACAASNWPLSTEKMPPRMISAMYAPVLIETTKKPANMGLISILKILMAP